MELKIQKVSDLSTRGKDPISY